MLLKASSVSNCSFTVDKLAAVCFHNTAIVIHFPIIMKKNKKVYIKKKTESATNNALTKIITVITQKPC